MTDKGKNFRDNEHGLIMMEEVVESKAGKNKRIKWRYFFPQFLAELYSIVKVPARDLDSYVGQRRVISCDNLMREVTKGFTFRLLSLQTMPGRSAETYLRERVFRWNFSLRKKLSK